jgi:hypothetical protein
MPKTSFDLKLPVEAPEVLVPGGDLAIDLVNSDRVSPIFPLGRTVILHDLQHNRIASRSAVDERESFALERDAPIAAMSAAGHFHAKSSLPNVPNALSTDGGYDCQG